MTEPRSCQGCGRPLLHARPDKTWCREACRQLTLRDRRWLRLSKAIANPKVNRRQLAALCLDLFGESMRAAEARAQGRSGRVEAAEGQG